MGLLPGFAALFKNRSFNAGKENFSSDDSKLIFEPLEPRVMLAADLAALNALKTSSYLEDLDTYLENNVYNQELLLINASLSSESNVSKFVTSIDNTLASFNLTDGELSIQGFKDEIEALFLSESNNYEVQIAVSGDEYSDELFFQLDFSFTYSTKFAASFDINDENFKLITMISNLEDGSSVNDMVDVDISMKLSYAFGLEEVLPADNPDKFYVDQSDAGGPDGIAGQYTINDKNGNILFKQKVDSDNSLLTDADSNPVYTDSNGDGEYLVVSGSYLKNSTSQKFLAIDAGCSVSEVDTLAEATDFREYDTLFSISSRSADSSGDGGVFSLDYNAILNDNFSAIGQIGGMTALIYEKDNISYVGEVGTDSNLTYDGSPVSTVTQLIDLVKNARPADKSESDLMFDFFADNDITSESHADGRIATSIASSGLVNYNRIYNSQSDLFSVEAGLSDTEFKAQAATDLYNEDVDLYLYAKMALIPELAAWTDLDIEADWLSEGLSDFSVFPELRVETPIFLHAGKTAADIAEIKGEAYVESDTLNYEETGAFQGYEILFAPSVLDAGMFWGNMIDSFVNQLGTLFDPIMPAVDLLLSPLPGLSDLTEMIGMGETTTVDFLQGIANLYALKDKGKAASALAVTESALEFITLLNKGSLPADNTPDEFPGDLNTGVFKLNKTLYDSEKKVTVEKTDATDTKDTDKVSETGNKAKKDTTETSVTVGGTFDFDIDTPFFTSPDQFVMALFAGDTSATLFNLDLLLEVAVEMEVTIPFLSIGVADLSLIIKPSFKVEFNVGAGFDLYGMNNFLLNLEWDSASGDNLNALYGSVLDNAGDILLDGFYFDDHYDETENEDGKEFTVALGIDLGLSVGIPDLGPVTVRAGVLGGLVFEFGVDLNDMPDKLPYYEWRDNPVDTETDPGMLYKYDSDQSKWTFDHHVHLNELTEMHRAKNMFELSVSATFRASIFVDIGVDAGWFSFTIIDWSMTLFEVTIFEASLSSPASHYDIIVNTEYVPPVMAGWQDESNGVLELYVGDKAGQRRYTNKDGTGIDDITDESYIINVLGFTQANGTYGDTDAGLGETIEINFNGGTQEVKNVKKIVGNAGDGDDKIQVRSKGVHESKIDVEFYGGSGDDVLSYTGVGAAKIFGDDGQDKIKGGSGNDTLTGGNGNDVIYGREGIDTITGGDGYDQIDGGEGDDILNGGNGGYELVEQVNGEGVTELVNGDYKGDEYFWEYGDGSDAINDDGVDSGENKDYDRLVIAGKVQQAGITAIQQSDDVDVFADSGKLKVSFAAGPMLVMDGIEEILLGVNGGGDTVDVFDYSATDLELLALGLDYDSFSVGGAELNILGTDNSDQIKAYTKREGSGDNIIDVLKIDKGGKYVIGINKSDAETDYLNIYGNAGDDTIEVISDDNTEVSDFITLGTVDGGQGNDTITVSNVTGKGDDGFKILGADGIDTITVNSSSNYIIIGEDAAVSPAVSSNDTINIDSGSDFKVYTGGGINTVKISNSSDFEVLTENSDNDITLENVSDFTADIKNGTQSITFNKKVADGDIDVGTGKATVKTGVVDAGLAFNLLRVTIDLAGGSVDGDVIDLKSAQALVLNASDDNDTLTIDSSKDITLNAGAGNDTVKLISSNNSTLNLMGGNDNATVTGSNTVIVNGGTGNDNIVSEGTTVQELYGEDGSDVITSSFGESVLDGESITVADSSDGTGLSSTVELEIIDNVLKVTNSEHGGVVIMTLSGMTGQVALNLDSKNNSAIIDNRVILSAVNSAWDITGGAGTDYFVIDTEVNNPVSIDGGSSEDENITDADKIIVNYQTGKNSGTMTSSSITGTGSAAITVSDLESAEVNLTAGNDEFTVSGMFGKTAVYGLAGDDTLMVESAPLELTLSGGNSTWAGSDGDSIVFNLNDSVTLDADTFKNVKITVPVFEIRNSGSTALNFMIKDKKIYSATENGIELIDLASSLSSGTLDSITISGNDSDTLTINDSELSESNAVEVDGNTIEYGNSGKIYLDTIYTTKYQSGNSSEGYTEGLNDSFVEWNYATPTRYYASPDKVDGRWEIFYDKSYGVGSELNGSIPINYNSSKLNYLDKDGNSASLVLVDNDSDGYLDITSADEFYALMRTTDLTSVGKKYELRADIDLSGFTNQCSIGSKIPYLDTVTEGFTGEINGNGYSITGFSSSSDTDNAGLLYSVKDGATVQNVEFINCSASTTADGKSAGIIIGENVYKDVVIRNVTLTNCTVSALTNGNAGGLVGYYRALYSTSTIENCYIKDSLIIGTGTSGGLIGSMVMDEGSKLTIKDCKVEGLKYSGANITSAGLIDNIKLYESYYGPTHGGKNLEVLACFVIDCGVKNGLFNTIDTSSGSNLICNSNVVEGQYVQDGVTFTSTENAVFNTANFGWSSVEFKNCRFSIDGVKKGIATSATFGNSSSVKFNKCTFDTSDTSAIVTSGFNTLTVNDYGEVEIFNCTFILNSALSADTGVVADSASIGTANANLIGSSNYISKAMNNAFKTLTGATPFHDPIVNTSLNSSSSNTVYGYDATETPMLDQYGHVENSDTGNAEIKGYLIPMTAVDGSGTYDYVYVINSEGRDNILCYEKSNITSNFVWYNGQESPEPKFSLKIENDAIQQLVATPDDNTLIAVGNNSVYGYSVNKGNGVLAVQDGVAFNEKVTATFNYGSNVYLGTEDGAFYRVSWNTTDSKWELSANLAYNNSGAYGRISGFKLSSDNKYLYALHQDKSAIEVYSVNTDGTFTLKTVLRDGVNGVRGISGVTGVVEKFGCLVACGYNDSTLAVFEIGDGHESFAQVQYLQNGAGVSGIDNPVEISESYYGVVIASETDTGMTFTEIQFSRAVWDSDPNTNVETLSKLWNIEYDGLDTLAFNMGSGGDSISINNADAAKINITSNAGGDQIIIGSALAGTAFNIDTGEGDDSVSVISSLSSNNFTVNTQAGDDTLNFGTIGGVSTFNTGDGNDTVSVATVLSQSTVQLLTGAGDDDITIGKVEAGSDSLSKTMLTVDAGDGNDSIELKIVENFTTVTLQGGIGNDDLTLYGAGINVGAVLSVYGNTATESSSMYGSLGNDLLTYYGAVTNTLTYPDNKISRAGDDTVLSYYTIDSIELPDAELFAAFTISMAADVDSSGGISEGDSIKFDASGSEVPANTTAAYEFDLDNDGVYEFTPDGAVSTITWAALAAYGIIDDGNYIVNMRVSAGGKVSTASSILNIANRKRKIQVAGDSTIVEDNEYTLTLDKNDSSEVGDDTIEKWIVNWGDGNKSVYSADSTAVKHTYGIAGNYNIAVTAYDEDGETEEAVKSLTVTEDTRKHIVIGNSAGESVDEGSAYTLILSSERPQSGAGIWKVNWGDGESSIQSTLNTANLVELTHSYADGSATGTDYVITVGLLDEEGSFSASHSVKVNNSAPVVTLEGDSEVVEGVEYSLTITAPVDAGDDAVSKYLIDWGDGSEVDMQTVYYAGQNYIAKHTYADADAGGEDYVIKVSAVDEDGTYDNIATKGIKILNAAPVITFDQAADSTTIAEGSIVRITGLSYSDVDSDTVAGWIIDWGDGSVDTYTPAEIQNFTSGIEHYYGTAGDYSVVVSAWDEDYSQATAVDSGAYAVTVTRVEDDNTASTSTPVHVPIWNEPQVKLADSVDSVDENKVYALTLSDYSYDLPSDISIDEILINWGDGIVETLTSAQFMALNDKESVILYHKYADDGSMDISITFRDKEVAKGTLNTTTVIENGDPETESGTVLKDGEPYYNGRRMVTDFGVIFSPGIITRDVDGVETSFYQEIVNENGVYKVKEFNLVETVIEYNNTGDAPALTVAVNDVAPEFKLSGKTAVMQGSVYTLNISDVIDVAGDELTQYVVDWGDGNTTVINSAAIASGEAVGDKRSLTHIYTLEGTKNIVITSAVSDGSTHSGALSNTLTLTVEDAPMSIELTGSDKVYELSDYSLTLGKITDPADLSRTVVPEKWIVKWGDGKTEEIVNSGNTTKELTHVYAGTTGFVYSIAVDFVVDGNTYTSTTVQNVTVANMPPVVSEDSAVTTIDEGGKFSGNYSFVDNGSDTSWTINVDYGDGLDPEEFPVSEKMFVLEHIYADDGNYTVRFTVTDSRGAVSNEITTGVTVNKVNPVIDISGIDNVNEAAEYSLTLSSVTDPGDDTVSSYLIDWGDGKTTPLTASELKDAGNVVKHAYGDNGTYVISLSMTDEDGTYSDITTKSVTVDNVVPVTSIAGADILDEGDEYSLTVGAVTDPGDDTVSNYTIDWGDGKTTPLSASELNDAGNVVKHVYSDNGTYVIRLSVTDEDGTYTNAATKSVTVNNIAPLTTISGNATLEEGSEYSVTVGTVTDPGDDTVSSYIIDWGDGKSTTISALDLKNAGNIVKHIYSDDGTPVIRLSLVDEDGTHTDVVTKSITVSDVAPVMTAVGEASTVEGAVYTLQLGQVTDPGDDTVSEYIIEWGDGEVSTVSAADLPADRIVTHLFIDDADTAIKVSLKNEDGVFSNLVVSDITVTNADPEMEVAASAGIIMQSTLFSNVVKLIDGGSADLLDVFIDYGNGEVEVIEAGTLREVVLSRSYSMPGDYTVSLYVKDDDGGISAEYSFAVKVVAIPSSGAQNGAADEDEDIAEHVNRAATSLEWDGLVEQEEDDNDNGNGILLPVLETELTGAESGRIPAGAANPVNLFAAGTAAASAGVSGSSISRLIDISDIMEEDDPAYTPEFINRPQTEYQEGQQQNTAAAEGSVQNGGQIIADVAQQLSTNEGNAVNMQSSELLLQKIQEMVSAQSELVSRHSEGNPAAMLAVNTEE